MRDKNWCLWVDKGAANAVYKLLAVAGVSFDYLEEHKAVEKRDYVTFSFSAEGYIAASGFKAKGLFDTVSIDYQFLQEIVVVDERPSIARHLRFPKPCHGCGALPGQIHKQGCVIEICSVCGSQKSCCDCEKHDPAFARWTGFWPGALEAIALDMDLNELKESGLEKLLFVKPLLDEGSDSE